MQKTEGERRREEREVRYRGETITSPDEHLFGF